eukprot:3031824-Pleurochrysis_carterae.AAC.3
MKGIIDRHYLHFSAGSPWAAANVPLMILDVLAYVFGIPLSLVLLIHSYLAATSTTTFEFIKMEKLDYLRGFYEFSCPFSQGLCTNLRHFCCPRGLQLWARPPPESEWPETWWRNRSDEGTARGFRGLEKGTGARYRPFTSERGGGGG